MSGSGSYIDWQAWWACAQARFLRSGGHGSSVPLLRLLNGYTAAAAVYPFNNLSNGTLDPCPPERKNLAWAHAHQACQSIYEPFPDIQHREPQVVLLFRHVTLLVPLRFFRRHQRAP